MKTRILVLLFILAIIVYGCATAGRESFTLGQELEKKNRLEDARAMYEEALAKEPGNQEYADALRKIKGLLVKPHMEKAQALLSQQPVTFDQLKNALNEADKASKLQPENAEVKSLTDRIKGEMEGMTKRAESLYGAASEAIKNKEWATAVTRLREIKAFYPDYLDLPAKLGLAEISGAMFYLQEADKYKAADDWGNALRMLTQAQQIQPNDPGIAAALKEAREKHSPESYIARAEVEGIQGNWDRAVILIQKASALNPGGQTLERLETLKSGAAVYYLDKSAKDLAAKRLLSAYTGFATAAAFDPAMTTTQQTAGLMDQLIGELKGKADAYHKNGNLGNAYVWYEKALKLSPTRKDLVQNFQTIKDRIRERVVKRIAVMDFTSPKDSPDAGRNITDSLLAYMTRTASGDVKILARDVLGAIMKEIELGQAGIYDIESAKQAGKLKGTDVFIFGGVLQYYVEKNVDEGQKIVNAVVGKKSIPNPSYQAWVMANPRAKEEDIRHAPPATIEEEVRETVRYKVANHKKTASIRVSFRVIDVEQGEVVITKMLPNKKEVQDTYSEGVSFANIPFKELKLPADTELLDQVVEETVTQLGYEVLSRFQNLQTLYSNQAEILKKRSAPEAAVEKYVDVMIVEEVKNITTHATENARKEIEQLLKTMAL